MKEWCDGESGGMEQQKQKTKKRVLAGKKKQMRSRVEGCQEGGVVKCHWRSFTVKSW